MVTRSLKYNFSQSDDKSRRALLTRVLVTIFFTVQLLPVSTAFAGGAFVQGASSMPTPLPVIEGALAQLNEPTRIDATFETKNGEPGEITVEAGSAFNPVVGDAAEVISPADHAQAPDLVIVQSDLSPAATQAFLDEHPALEQAMLNNADHTVLVHSQLQWLPKQQLKEGVVYTVMRTGISTCVYLHLLNHVAPASDEEAIATTFALTFLFNTTNLYYVTTHFGQKLWSALGFKRFLESIGLTRITRSEKHYYEASCFLTWLTYGILSTDLYKGFGVTSQVLKPAIRNFLSSFPWSRTYYRWVHFENPPMNQVKWAQRAVWLRAIVMAFLGPMIMVGHNSGAFKDFVDGLTFTGITAYFVTYQPIRVQIGRGYRGFVNQMRTRWQKVVQGARRALTSRRAKECWEFLVVGATKKARL